MKISYLHCLNKYFKVNLIGFDNTLFGVNFIK